VLQCTGLLGPRAGQGHKQTHTVTHAESASPLKADIASLLRYVRSVPLPDNALQQTALLFDHLVGEREQLLWNRDAKGLRGFEVDEQLKFRRLLNR
jgi:hypothetical protein